jgi:hypothetical protein
MEHAAIVQPCDRRFRVDQATAQRDANGVDFTRDESSAQRGAAKFSKEVRGAIIATGCDRLGWCGR